MQDTPVAITLAIEWHKSRWNIQGWAMKWEKSKGRLGSL